MTHQGRSPSADSPTSAVPDKRLVGDRVGQLAELGDQAALAGEFAVEPVGDRCDREDRPRRDPPGRLVPVAVEQHDREHRHQQQPEHGERVGDVPRPTPRWARRRSGRRATGANLHRAVHARARCDQVGAVGGDDELPGSTAPRRIPVGRRSAGSRRRRPGPGGPPGRRRHRPTCSTRTSTRSPMRSSARCATNSSASALMRSTRSAIDAPASSLPSNPAASVPSSSEYPNTPIGVEAGRGQEALELREIGLGLAGEPDDHVAARARGRAERARAIEQVEEGVRRAEPLHPAQHGRARVLEGQVEVRRDAGRRGDGLQQRRAQLGRLQVGHADPLDAVDARTASAAATRAPADRRGPCRRTSSSR